MTPPTTPEVREWIRLLIAVVVVAFALYLIAAEAIRNPALIEGEFKTLFGWFLGFLSGVALFLYPKRG